MDRRDSKKDFRKVNGECEDESQENEPNKLHDVHGSNGCSMSHLAVKSIAHYTPFVNSLTV
jgi:hypothetical protein